jgi:hypothetical protein
MEGHLPVGRPTRRANALPPRTTRLPGHAGASSGPSQRLFPHADDQSIDSAKQKLSRNPEYQRLWSIIRPSSTGAPPSLSPRQIAEANQLYESIRTQLYSEMDRHGLDSALQLRCLIKNSCRDVQLLQSAHTSTARERARLGLNRGAGPAEIFGCAPGISRERLRNRYAALAAAYADRPEVCALLAESHQWAEQNLTAN